MSSTQLVGNRIDAAGLKIKEENLNKVTGFPLTTTIMQLSSLLGLANYFKDHVQNYSVIAKPLRQFLSGYKKRNQFHKLDWAIEL